MMVFYEYIGSYYIGIINNNGSGPYCIQSSTHVIRILKGIQNLLELHEFSNSRSSDYFSKILKKISRGCFFMMQSIVQAKEEQYIQILFIRTIYIFLNNNIVKVYRNMRIRMLQLLFFKKITIRRLFHSVQFSLIYFI